jgi:hypothetical protein
MTELGDCFKKAYETATAEQRARGVEAYVVHGVVDHPVSGRHWHAWCEVDVVLRWSDEHGEKTHTMVMCVDRANGLEHELPRDLYYTIGNIQEDSRWRYTVADASRHMVRERHYGPWVEDADEVCDR